ncbi:MAG: Hemin uptake protein hemP [Planctomycetaceae bacterium]|nr:Hemin uptake protein hemP [Planctomycetaceae bacterium]
MMQPEDPQKPGKSAENSGLSAQIPHSQPAISTAPGGIKQPRQVRSDALLHGDRELQIIHGDEIYRLSVTRQGKLILHK